MLNMGEIEVEVLQRVWAAQEREFIAFNPSSGSLHGFSDFGRELVRIGKIGERVVSALQELEELSQER